MAHPEKRPYTIELYLLLPSIVALLTLGIGRSPDIGPWPRLTLLAILAVASFASTKSPALLLVGASVFLEKFVFAQPVVSYLGAVVISLHLLLTAEHHRQPTLLRGSLLLLGLGLPSLLFEFSSPHYLVLECTFATAAFARFLEKTRPLRFFSNPLAYLTMELPDNRYRFQLACLAFLSLGGPSWSRQIQMMQYEYAALLHTAITLLTVPLILDALHIDAMDAEEFATLHTQKAQLTAEIAIQQKSIAELRTSSQSLHGHRDDYMSRLNDDLRFHEESETRRIQQQSAEAQQALDASLALQKQTVTAELQAAFYSQPFDSLVAHLCDKDSVSLPDGQILSTRDHLLIGTRRLSEGSSHRIEPVFIHKKILHEHVHILGGTGTGKTAQGITPIAVQLLRQEECAPMIFLDLKGDSTLFHTAREEAERNNQDFLFFSIESNKSTYRFNPFVGIKKYGGTLNEQTQPLLDALGLNHGDGYGKSFFTRGHRQRMFEAFKRNPNISSFADLKNALASVLGGKPAGSNHFASSQKDELIAAIEGIAEYPQLFTTPEEEAHGNGIIQFDQVFAKNQVVYFWLPAPTQSISAREIGKLVLYNLFFAALKRKDRSESKRAYLFIDEFQRIIGENLALFLEQSRSYGVSLILANQNIDQLNTADAKLWPLVQSNVRASLHFGSGDPKEIDILSKASGEVIDKLSTTARGGSTGSSRGTTRSKSEGETHSSTRGVSLSVTNGVSQTLASDGSSSDTTSSQIGQSHSESSGSAKSQSQSFGESNSSSQSESFENSEAEYLRPRLRNEDIQSIFNKGGHFLYWVRRGVSPLVDFDGKPIEVRGLFAMPEHQQRRRASSRWPEMAGNPTHVIQSAVRYKAAGTVTEKSMVSEIFSALKEPY